MSLKNAQVLLTVSEGGVSVRRNELVREIVEFFYYERDNYDIKSPSKPKKSVMTRGTNVIHHYPLVETTCTRKLRLSADSINYFISEEGIAKGIDKFNWKRMSAKMRLEAHLKLLSEGNSFTYEVIE